MFPISKRTVAAIVAAGALSVTLLAVPAHAAGSRAFQTQDTSTWSIFSWSFWENAFQPVLTWFQTDDHQTTAQRADGPGSMFDSVRQLVDPNGASISSTSPEPTTVSETGTN